MKPLQETSTTPESYVNDNPKVDWEKEIGESRLSLEAIHFFFLQAEKMLESVIDIGASFQNRAITILTLLVPTVLSMFAIIASYTAQSSYDLKLILPFVVSGVLLTRAAYLCTCIINTRTVHIKGCKPSQIFHQEWLKYEVEPTNKQLAYILLNECRSYQKKIASREDENKKFGAQFKELVMLLILSPASAIVTFSMLLIF